MTDGQQVRSFMGPSDENVLKVDSGHDHTTLNMLEIGEWYVSKSGFCNV